MPDRLTADDLREYCLAKAGAWPDEPWDGDTVAKGGDKIFAFLGASGVGLKCGANREEADELIDSSYGTVVAKLPRRLRPV
ncbi:MmcQ/YjbR family DNA-binding protein [Kribbella sp. WER1]